MVCRGSGHGLTWFRTWSDLVQDVYRFKAWRTGLPFRTWSDLVNPIASITERTPVDDHLGPRCFYRIRRQ